MPKECAGCFHSSSVKSKKKEQEEKMKNSTQSLLKAHASGIQCSWADSAQNCNGRCANFASFHSKNW